jgi:hypothetical protein
VSHPKFAPITSSLLARKGSAVPSMMGISRAPVFAPPKPVANDPPLAPAIAQHVEAHIDPMHDASHDAPHAHVKKLFVSLSPREHERLAIAAVKTGLSRHQLVRDALDTYFEQLARDMGDDCRCVSGSCAGACAIG